jgi:hypothetical protein
VSRSSRAAATLRLEVAAVGGGTPLSIAAGEWDEQIAFAGLQFLIGAETHFGWARLQVTGTALGLTATLFDYAYCDEPNAAIDAGQTSGACGATNAVPEPSSLVLLATGTVAAALRSRRRGQKAA